MSTLKGNITAKRLVQLAARQESVFHSGDLANLWRIPSGNTLRTTLKRYHQQGLIHRLRRGLYTLLPPDVLDPLLLGAKSIHQHCYLSTESVLFEAGIIAQAPSQYTFISSRGRHFGIAGHQYLCRQLVDEFLFQPCGMVKRGGITQATPERAIADMLYYNPWYHFDAPVDWEAVKAMQFAIGYPLTPHRYAPAKARRRDP